MPQRFEGRQIMGIPVQDVTQSLPRFFIVSEAAIRLGAAPGSLNRIRVEDQGRVEGTISGLKIGMREGGASASHGDGCGYRTILESVQKMIGSIGIVHIKRSNSGGRERRIALLLRKTFGQSVPLCEQNRRAVFIFQAMDQQRARRVIFEQREI